MENYYNEATVDSPSMLFDTEKGLIEIKGKSLPEDAIICYSPLLLLVREYVKSPKPKTTLVFRLEYLNTSSSKKILEIISLLEELPSKGYAVEIKWFYNTNDEDMHDEGEEFKKMTDLPISLEREY